MVEVAGEVEKSREKEEWRRAAFLAAEVINISGKVSKRTVRPEQLIRFDDEVQMTPEAVERRRREAVETAKAHKAKFWTKIKGEEIEKLTENQSV